MDAVDLSGAHLAFRIPVLPDSAPSSPSPSCFRHPLLPHQRRALRRMQQLEGDGALREDCFGTAVEVSARGGVLADAVGMGKTAVTLALIASEPRDDMCGPNLIVLPKHLIAQWRREAEKFIAGGEVDVLVGREEYERALAEEAGGGGGARTSNRTVVLVTVTEVLEAPCVHYDFRRVFARVDAAEAARAPKGKYSKTVRDADGRRWALREITRQYSAEQMAEYRRAAIFVNGGYAGKVYSGALHWPPGKAWRRVILDEVQDLCRPATEAQDNFVQLTRRASNVWLISATPFPLGDASIYANHQLLGFHRLRLSVQHATGGLPASHPFEVIKRRLYIRSTDACQRLTIADRVEVREETVEVEMHGVERVFYENLLAELAAGDGSCWDEEYNNLRQTCCHPAASSQIREEMISMNADGDAGPADLVSCMRHSLASLARRAYQRLQRDVVDTVSRIDGNEKAIAWTEASLGVARIVRESVREMGAAAWDAFRLGVRDAPADDFVEASMPVPEEELRRRMIEGAGGEATEAAVRRLRIVLRHRSDADARRSDHDAENYCFGYRTCARYVRLHWTDEEAIGEYAREQSAYLRSRQTAVGKDRARLRKLEGGVQRFARLLEGGLRRDATLAGKYGSKPAALVGFVQTNADAKIIGTLAVRARRHASSSAPPMRNADGLLRPPPARARRGQSSRCGGTSCGCSRPR